MVGIQHRIRVIGTREWGPGINRLKCVMNNEQHLTVCFLNKFCCKYIITSDRLTIYQHHRFSLVQADHESIGFIQHLNPHNCSCIRCYRVLFDNDLHCLLSVIHVRAFCPVNRSPPSGVVKPILGAYSWIETLMFSTRCTVEIDPDLQTCLLSPRNRLIEMFGEALNVRVSWSQKERPISL